MYKVYCRGRKNSKWKPYSKKFNTLEEAENCKKNAEDRRICDIYNNIIIYKINHITENHS